MAQAPRTYTGDRDGRAFKMMHAPLCDVLSVDLRSFVWHLWIEGEYRGNFPTKTAAHAFMDADCTEPDEIVWLRDLDGTGSMHPCTPHCPGAIRYVRDDLAVQS